MRFVHLKTHPGFEPLRLRGLSGARDKLHFAAIVQNLKTLAARPGTIAACLRVRCVSASEGGVGGMNVKADATQWGGAKTQSAQVSPAQRINIDPQWNLVMSLQVAPADDDPFLSPPRGWATGLIPKELDIDTKRT